MSNLRSSITYFDHRFPTWLHSVQDVDNAVQNTEAIQISDTGHTKEPDSEDGNYTDNFLLICRGYLPAYLISSRAYAVNILVSQLSPPVWDQQHHWGSAALSLTDESHWYTLLQAYFEEGGDIEMKLGRRQTRGAGLVLALQGSKILTRIMANSKLSYQ
ncbi:hypothetical protein LB503_011684 [Fusarium chuoi]|nr:hypothetical protein LB503_011684 [Fusarium chuoi]